jgi:hypothetical protein
MCHGQALLCRTSLDCRAEDPGREVNILRGLYCLAAWGGRALLGRKGSCTQKPWQARLSQENKYKGIDVGSGLAPKILAG